MNKEHMYSAIVFAANTYMLYIPIQGSSMILKTPGDNEEKLVTIKVQKVQGWISQCNKWFVPVKNFVDKQKFWDIFLMIESLDFIYIHNL